MGVVPVLVVFSDVTETDKIQLLLASAAGRVDRKQDGERDETADKADGHGNFEVSKQQEAIERVVIENIAVGDLVKGSDPVEQAIRKLWRPLPWKKLRQYDR